MNTWHRHFAAWPLLLITLTACQSGPKTSVITQGDLDEATVRMAQSLAQSPLLAGRMPDSPRMVVVVNKIENLTDDIIPEAEEWMLIARLEGSLPIINLSREKNIHFQVPPERAVLVRGAGYSGTVESGWEATHVMNAVYRSSKRDQRNSNGVVVGREDYYTMEYQMTALNSREVLWHGAFEYKRQAVGKVID